MTLTEEQIAEIRARADAATPGPWRHVHGRLRPQFKVIINQVSAGGRAVVAWAGFDGLDASKTQIKADARFIAHARTDIPLLISALEAANKRADEAEARYKTGLRNDALLELSEYERENDALRARVAELEESEIRVKHLEEIVEEYRAYEKEVRDEIVPDMAREIGRETERAEKAASELTTLHARVAEVEMALYALREAARGQVVVVNTASSRIKELEAVVARLREALAALDRMNRGLDWCDHDEQARRWSAARRVLEACGTTEAIEAVAASLSGTPSPIPGDTPK